MKNAQTLGSGLETEHQMYYGIVDQTYHTAAGGEVDTTKAGVDLLGEVELYQPPIGTYFQGSFGHLMGYQGAYYGYLWSLVYAQDMFERFEEKGILNPEAGRYYREKILSRGGTMDEMDMLRDYLGREPRMDAFLKHLGLKK
jgi:Zn-dependent oligopeptidase